MQKLAEHPFIAPIWRLHPSSNDYPSWVVETRSTNQQVAYFYCTPNSKPLPLTLNITWWSGVETVIGKHIVFHDFAQQDMPFHQGIKVVDGEKSKLLWEDDFLIFKSANENLVLATVPTGNQNEVALELLTGIESSTPFSQKNSTEANQPLHFSSDDEHFKSITTFVHSLTGHTPIRSAEYLENSTYIFLSYFIPNGKNVDNCLLVTNTEGKILLHTTLSSQLKGITLGTFYVSNGLLSFVQDRNKLVVYRLTSNA